MVFFLWRAWVLHTLAIGVSLTPPSLTAWAFPEIKSKGASFACGLKTRMSPTAAYIILPIVTLFCQTIPAILFFAFAFTYFGKDDRCHTEQS